MAPSRYVGSVPPPSRCVEAAAARIANAAANTSRSAVGKKGGKSGSYDDWTVSDLRKRAAELDIGGRSSMSKSDLVKALRDH